MRGCVEAGRAVGTKVEQLDPAIIEGNGTSWHEPLLNGFFIRYGKFYRLGPSVNNSPPVVLDPLFSASNAVVILFVVFTPPTGF